MWDLSSRIRDRTHGLCTGSTESTTGLPGKSLGSVLLSCITYPAPENVRYFSDHFQYLDCKHFLKVLGYLPDSPIDLYKRT